MVLRTQTSFIGSAAHVCTQSIIRFYKTDEERFQNIPRGVSAQEWVFLLDYFKSKDFKVKIHYHIPIALFFLNMELCLISSKLLYL
jgi:hypothetical protein